MAFFRTLTRTLILFGKENAFDVLSAIVLPGASKAVAKLIGRQPTRWLAHELMTIKTVDGAIIGGLVPSEAGAKFALPKGLPKAGTRSLAIENDPHTLEGFDGVIESGYGKGRKSLLFTGRVPVKVGRTTSLKQIEYHVHDADVAGLHWDLAIAGLPPGTRRFELNIPNSEFKGRYAFVTTPKGIIVVPMVEDGVLLAKPNYKLVAREALENFDPAIYEFTRKIDGSLGTGKIGEGRAFLRSHRDTGEVYFDKIPSVEDLHNHSRVWLSRKLMPFPDLKRTVVQGELVHPDGAPRVSGILNALPERAQAIQELRGPVDYYVWDIDAYKGRDVSHLPYWKRRQLLESVVKDVRVFNKHWHAIEVKRDGENVEAFYARVTGDPHGLPWSEGVVIKHRFAPAGALWYKAKVRDNYDLKVVGFIEGAGKYHGSLGAIEVEGPTGSRGEVGSFQIPNSQRDWIWTHKDELVGQVAEISAMEITEAGVPRAGTFVRWHPQKSDVALMQYAESVAGGDPARAKSTLYALKSAAGWRKAA
jgi:hypothetical protein